MSWKNDDRMEEGSPMVVDPGPLVPVHRKDNKAAVAFTWCPPPSSPGELTYNLARSDEKTALEDLAWFLQRWPPSRTPKEYGPWIRVNKTCLLFEGDTQGLVHDFHQLSTGNKVSADAIDSIARKNQVLTGKWMIFEDSARVDELWNKIAKVVCTERTKGHVKVSTKDEGKTHVICAYVSDYTDLGDVRDLREKLRKVGVVWTIGFKTDAYTHLGIYHGNRWGLETSVLYE